MPSIIHKKSVEGFGIAYVEAAQYGVTSLGGIDGGASDAIQHEKTGLIWDGNNLEEVLSTLKTGKLKTGKKKPIAVLMKTLNCLKGKSICGAVSDISTKGMCSSPPASQDVDFDDEGWIMIGLLTM